MKNAVVAAAVALFAGISSMTIAPDASARPRSAQAQSSHAATFGQRGHTKLQARKLDRSKAKSVTTCKEMASEFKCTTVYVYPDSLVPRTGGF